MVTTQVTAITPAAFCDERIVQAFEADPDVLAALDDAQVVQISRQPGAEGDQAGDLLDWMLESDRMAAEPPTHAALTEIGVQDPSGERGRTAHEALAYLGLLRAWMSALSLEDDHG